MKTTLILRDDLVRRAKSRAALRGWTLSHYMEKCLEQNLKNSDSARVGDWLKDLPPTPDGATRDVDNILRDADFQEIEPEMWQ